MNIEQIREARRDAEEQIAAALQEFRTKTGLHIESLHVTTYSSHPIQFRQQDGVVQVVQAEIARI